MKSKKIKKEIQIKNDRNFFEDVYDVARQIPKGRVTTYGAIAAFIGAKSSARMVGWALSTSHSCVPPVPAQRVVNRNGQLSGRMHFSTPTEMEELLNAEGIEVKDNAVKDFDRLFWDPMELDLGSTTLTKLT